MLVRICIYCTGNSQRIRTLCNFPSEKGVLLGCRCGGRRNQSPPQVRRSSKLSVCEVNCAAFQLWVAIWLQDGASGPGQVVPTVGAGWNRKLWLRAQGTIKKMLVVRVLATLRGHPGDYVLWLSHFFLFLPGPHHQKWQNGCH